MPPLDVISIGRSSVDLYGGQVGGRLEDIRTFRKYIGGSPTNTAAGAARLGLKSAVITRVGDEHMGRFIRERLRAEGVDVRGVITDPDRLTALVLLGIRDRERFPLIFYRENCADMALSPNDIDPDLIAEARCLLVSGTHLSHPRTEAAILRALDLAEASGAMKILDIDYRPNLWGLSGHGDGENRFIESKDVTARLQGVLARFDVIVGTEEEFHIAGGATATLVALVHVREATGATLVCKRGAMGATAFVGPIPASLDEGIRGEAFEVEVFNVLGAGDGFIAGLLKGWLSGEAWSETLRIANACGALAVSRHGCTPAYPSVAELRHFLDHGPVTAAVREDPQLEHIHWATIRAKSWPDLRVFAFDHRAQLEEIARRCGCELERIGAFKRLCLDAALRVADGRDGFGILCDGRHGRDALYAAAGTGLWIGRPVEKPGTRPLQVEIGDDFGSALAEWPSEHVVKVLCFYRPDDPGELRADQESTIKRLAQAARANELDFLLEVVPSKFGLVDQTVTAEIVERFYEIGVFPDWWKLEPMVSDEAWQNVCDVIAANDPHSRGVLVLGLDTSFDELRASFDVAAKHDLVKGFAVGRTIFADVADDWMSGDISDEQAVERMAGNLGGLCAAWGEARAEQRPG